MLGVTSAAAAGTLGSRLLGSKAEDGQLAVKMRSLTSIGENQNGIELPIQQFANFISLDLKPDVSIEQVRGWMKIISDDIDRLMAGKKLLADSQPQITKMKSNLTVTVGFGPGLFEKLGIQDKAPANFKKLPPFKIDQLQSNFSDGDVLFQVASDSTIHLEYVTRALIRDSVYFSDVRWTQKGFSSVAPESSIGSQRNMMGQIDGTSNPDLGSSLFKEAVWADSGPDWFVGGTMLVFRRIKMNLDTWDILEEEDKENVIGRKLDNGAPLGGNSELDVLNFAAKDEAGLSIIPPFAHVARAHLGDMKVAPIFRRPFNFSDGFSEDGKIDAGLLWIAYCKDAHLQYVPIQRRLEELDLLNKWTTPVGSAIFAIPGGRRTRNEIIGESLFV